MGDWVVTHGSLVVVRWDVELDWISRILHRLNGRVVCYTRPPEKIAGAAEAVEAVAANRSRAKVAYLHVDSMIPAAETMHHS